MMNFKKLLSLFLAALMLCGSLTGLSVISVSAAEATAEEPTEGEDETIDYYNHVFASPEDKLATMELKTTKGNYAIYADVRSGEVAVKDLRTGQILFTNPYDIGTATASNAVKNQLLSQIIVKFTENGREREYSSYEYAALKDQIKIKNIKNGIRVEYTIGREEARLLVPHWIEENRFKQYIITPLEEHFSVSWEEAQRIIKNNEFDNPLHSNAFYFKKFMDFYTYKNKENCASDALKQEMLKDFPITDEMAIYVLSPETTNSQMQQLEETIKTGCPDYSYEEMDYDHQLTEYVSEDENHPLFKMALEYTVEADGFSVRLPANGIRFNESVFQLTNVSVLPYMGAGNNAYEGYTFYPDGSGALFAFEDLLGQNTNSVASKIYGVDYAYHTITGTYQQAVRYPVYGIMEKTEFVDCLSPDDETGEDKITTLNNIVYQEAMADPESDMAKKYATLIANSELTEYTVNRGFVAIIEEGDALAELVNYHAGPLSPYDTVQMNFNPRPKDSYNIADAISVGTNSEWTVVSNRKYVGNYKIRYVMLSDEEVAADKNLPDGSWYEASWLGMAKAYRDYLTAKGILSPLSADKTTNDIPLYIESFGAMKTIEKILSVPVEVKKPLTSAADIITMYEELSGKGVTNINFKLTGFANGGMYSSVPYGLKWEKAVSEDVTMQKLFDYAANLESGNLGLFPDFDFSYAYSTATKMFDGFSMREHAVRTIDDRYTYKREYMATQQKYTAYYQMAISPAYFSHFYEKLMKNYLKHDNITGISVGSLGNALNSDFDEDEPYNREDSKSFVAKALEYISGAQDGNMEVMVDGGNAYTWQYVDHILGASLDSSRYIKASYSVPFVGVVLHGSVNFAGSPLNMEGDLNYAKLKAIENGASVYFTLSYQNTQNLKEDVYLSKYYSVRYDIWFDDVVEIYNELNSQLKDVQDKLIIDHQFLSGTRVPDTTELDRDITNEFEAILDIQNNKAEYDLKQKAEAVADARDKIASVETAAKNFVKDCVKYYSEVGGAMYLYITGSRSFERRLATYIEAEAAYNQVKAEYDAADEAGKEALADHLASAEAAQKQALGQMKNYIRNIGRAIANITKEYEALSQLLEDAQSGKLLISNTADCPQSIIDEITAQMANTEKMMSEGLGVTFNMSVDKAEVDTFLYTHIATLMFSCYGESSHGKTGIVGKAENIYQMLTDENYGLLLTELDLIRYLSANRDLSDDQLIEKYGLSADRSSVDGLILYMKELLGENYTFDPLVATVPGAIEENIKDYFIAILASTVNGLNVNSVVPALNISPVLVNNKGEELTNTNNVSVVTKLVDRLITDKLTGPKGVMNNVTDGNYDLNTVYGKDQLDALVASAVSTLQKYMEEGAQYPIEYLTPDTLEADVRNYIEATYYHAVIGKILPKDAGNSQLRVLKVSSKTDSTMTYLAEERLAAYGEITGLTKYATLIEAYKNDTELAAALDLLNETVKGSYGDVRGRLEQAYLQIFASIAREGDKAPTLSAKAGGDTTKLRTAATKLMNAKMNAAVNLDNIGDLIDELIALHDQYEMKDGYDKIATSTQYVYFFYFKMLAESEIETFYYDAQMAQLDAAVRSKVENASSALKADLSDDVVIYDLYDKILNALADPDDSLTDFAAAVAANVSYATTGTASLKNEVLTYYTYLLFAEFGEYKLGAKPEITVLDASVNLANAMKIVDRDLEDRIPAMIAMAKEGSKRGEMVNYSLSSFMTEADIQAAANELVDALIAAKFATEEKREQLIPELIEYLQYNYYSEALSKLNIEKLPTFHIAEIYNSTLYESSQNLKELLYYYVTTFTDMTVKDIEQLINSGLEKDEEEEDEEDSRYLSDDGRIVSVTYGQKNADGSYSAYKTFVLNYNNFSVDVEYEGTTYTIPAYGYVVVMNGSQS